MRCERCDASVPRASVGDNCPSCGVYFSGIRRERRVHSSSGGGWSDGSSTPETGCLQAIAQLLVGLGALALCYLALAALLWFTQYMGW